MLAVLSVRSSAKNSLAFVLGGYEQIASHHLGIFYSPAVCKEE